MTFDEVQQAIKSKQVQVVPPSDIPENDDPIDQQAKPSFDEFLTTVMGLRNIRLGRLAVVKLPAATDNITANFKPTRFLRAYFLAKGKSASTPVYVQFNGDTNLNYCYPSNPSVSKVIISGADTTSDERGLIDIINEATASKSFFSSVSRWSGAAASAPTSVTNVGGWENTTSQITSIKLLSASGQTFAAGSYLIVYGTD